MSNLTKTALFIVHQRTYSSHMSQSKVIKLPVYVQEHVEKLKKREFDRKFDVMRKVHKRGDTSKPVISCNKKEYNFYLGQIYNNKFPIPLVSKHWLKMKSAGQKFTINSWAPNPSLPVEIEIPPGITEKENDYNNMAYYISKFSQLNLSEQVSKSIAALGYELPTPIQAMVIPKILNNKNVLCVAETGSGKTMSYLIPIIDNLVKNKSDVKRYSTPLALIITPGRELAEQIAKEAYALGNSCGIIVKSLVPGGTEFEELVPKYGDEIDLLVASFGTICTLSSKNIFKLSHLRHLVFEEADTLLDDSFKEDMEKFFRRLHVRNSGEVGDMAPVDIDFGAQISLISSTVPKSVFERESFFSDIEFVNALSPHIHSVLPHIPQKFIRVNNENRSGVFLELVKKDYNKKVPLMIFCNKYGACDWVHYFLSDNGINNMKFHSNMSFEERAFSLRNFQSGDIDVLCCTDLASRGLDTQRTKHVINYDFPNSVSDYILRVGRVGRIGTNHGHVTNLILQKSGVYVLQDIEMAIRNKKWKSAAKIENVDANIKKKIQKMFYSY